MHHRNLRRLTGHATDSGVGVGVGNVPKPLIIIAGAAFLLALTSTGMAHAQVQTATRPVIGAETTVTAGEVMLEEYRFRGAPGVALKGSVRANWGSAEAVALPEEALLAIIRSRRLKACEVRTSFGWRNCVIDTDDDGYFDRVSFNDVGGAKEIDPPVAYEKTVVEIALDPRRGEGDDFKRQLIYAGATPDTLSLNYREFVNNLSRPAFTETLMVPITKTYPQNVAVKGRVFSILGIDGMGLRYRLVR